MSLITDLGLDQQYTTDRPILYSIPIVFPKVIDKEAIKYLVSLGYTCVFDKILKKFKSTFSYWDLDTYRR